MDPNSHQKYASQRRMMGICFFIQLVILFVSFIIVRGLNRYTGFLEYLFGIHIRYNNVSDYVRVDILLIITVMCHILMVLEPMSEIWVDWKERTDFPLFHFWTMTTYVVSACYGLRVVSEHHIVLFTSAGARATMEFISIICIAWKGPLELTVSIFNMGVFFIVGSVLVYYKFLTIHQKAYEVVFGSASTIMTIFMAITSVATTFKKVKSSTRRLGVASFIAPFSLLISSLLWMIFANLANDMYTEAASVSLFMAGILQAIFLYD